MKFITVLFAGFDSQNCFEKSFGNRSAFDLSLSWAQKISGTSAVYVLADSRRADPVNASVKGSGVKVVSRDGWTVTGLLESLHELMSSSDSENAVFAWADCPFLNAELTGKLIELHQECRAEYTFAEGYPHGLAPEIIHRDSCAMLAELSRGIKKDAGDRAPCPSSIFSVMSADINSFEIETLVCPSDFRLYRFDFSVSSVINRAACENLYAAASGETDPVRLCELASKNCSVLKTVPAFFNVQIAPSYNHDIFYIPYKKLCSRDGKFFECMSLEKYRILLEKIVSVNPRAVISLSCWGEPLLNEEFTEIVLETLKHEGLSLFIETDGLLVTDDIAGKISGAADGRVDWCIFIDACDRDMYVKIHDCPAENFDRAVNSVSVLEQYFPHHVYPQMTRMKINECQLEGFYKFWKNRESPSKGEVIIQKYDSFSGFLSDEKSADLSPLERNPCWHLRRDMNILADGSVPLCRHACFKDCRGNVFEQDIADVFHKFDEKLCEHIKCSYEGICGECDEYYTFNF